MARGRLNSGSKAEAELPKAKINSESLKRVARLLSYLRPYRAKFIFGMFLLFLSSLTGLAFPAILGALIDAAQGIYKNKFFPHSLNAIGIFGFALLFGQAFVSFFRVVFFVQVAEKSLADIRRDTYFKLITLPMNFFANRRVGELNSRISADLSQIQDTLTTTIAEVIRQLVIMAGSVTLLVIVSGKLTLMLLSILPFLIAFAVVFGKFIRKLSRQAQDKLAESNTVVEETLQGIANVKAFVHEAYEANRYDKILREVVGIAVKGAKFRGIFASFIVFCLFGTFVGVIWYGSTLIQNHDINVGQLTTFIMYSIFVGAAMGSFPDLYANLQKAIGASERVLEILGEQGEPISMIEAENATVEMIRGDLSFQNITFHYPSRPEITVLKYVSFDAKAGQKVAIVGPSGSGKSTMASLILQFYHPQEGNIQFDGRNADSYSLTDVRNQVAIVPQDVLLFGGTILENIAYGKMGATNDEVIKAAQRANAHQFISGFPEGYETVVGERGVKLSGGQRQRIAIARALLKNPSILILDEATSSLDSESERLVQEALEELMVGRTSIIIAHRLSTIREADQIVVIEKGTVVETGSHTKLMENEGGLYRYLSQLQTDSKESLREPVENEK
ncbi:ABC transporter ATP-binding protein [Mucilaginibacter myungsuensis]|uniref:ATP-binding cassette domain-containing protein n=1 Tax=Mucilaginibacter myungsuensis TaxID=649104 RepID=A0A929L1D7_9SPHI|nr:ABC transporter transmembrane domain-containing protein [Mucilaginibacter myungsuensis]MBE9664427.1 ATP-binding cassette domain-containing protein [Mucilaginibacter myungsuensis]MDN3597138.1 ABC transporter transmembrane domain-containing protein [Mucilaginibacter myungsuensis]